MHECGGIRIARYGAGIFEWAKQDLEKLNQMTIEIMAMYRGFHPRRNVTSIYRH